MPIASLTTCFPPDPDRSLEMPTCGSSRGRRRRVARATGGRGRPVSVARDVLGTTLSWSLDAGDFRLPPNPFSIPSA